MADGSEMAWVRNRLREADLFEGLTELDLFQVASIGGFRKVAAGQRLASAGSRGANVFTLLRGELIVLLEEAGKEVSLRRVHPNETVPLAALLDPPVLVTTIEAAVDSVVYTIPRSGLIELCERQPTIGLHVYREVAKVFERRYRATLKSPGGYEASPPGRTTA